MSKPPIPLKGKSRRLKSLNEFEAPYWKGLFQPWRKAEVVIPLWIVAVVLVAGVGIGILIVLLA